MDLYEYQARDLFDRHGVPVPPGALATTPEQARRAAQDMFDRGSRLVVVKAQVKTGGRGKAGGVKPARTAEEAGARAAEILGMDIKGHPVRAVLVADGVEIASELYVALLLDRAEHRDLVMCSREGGMDIETLAAERPEALARMRREQSATGDTIMRRVPDAAPTTPSAFLIYAGSAPVEVVRDVIIGRDPNTRVLTGRPMAAPLRVPSPGSEISRSHCAVMATAPGVWSLMDLASVNGSILVHPDGSSEDVPAMVGVPLADGDLIDLGEGVTVEFRVR